MAVQLSALALALALAATPMTLDVARQGDAIVLSIALPEELPEAITERLSTGATTEIDYALRVYAPRKLIPDRRVWKATAKATVTFDAVTGRYLCQLIVNGDTTASREVDTLEAARRWLRSPPAVEFVVPPGRRDDLLRVRARAIFASGTSWLVFPTTEGTEWVEVQVEARAADEAG